MKPLNILLACTLTATTSALAHADFTYQETTQITGGSVVSLMKFAGAFSKQARQAGDHIVTTVTVKSNRMLRAGKDRTEIIDLDAGSITVIDHLKKQYTTMTFEQMRQQMEAAMAKAKAQQSKQQEQPADNTPQNVDVKFNVKVRNTGATKDVAGVSTNESIMTMTMDATDKTSGQTGSLAITNDMYLAPDIPGYDEVRDFYKRYGQKMGTVMSGAINTQTLAMMQQPAAGKGMAEMAEEMSKLKGIPVLQIMRMGTTTDGTPLARRLRSPNPHRSPASVRWRYSETVRQFRGDEQPSLRRLRQKEKAGRSSPGRQLRHRRATHSSSAHGVEHPDDQLLPGIGRSIPIQSARRLQAGRAKADRLTKLASLSAKTQSNA